MLARVTEYTVNPLDVEDGDFSMFHLTVEWRGGANWAVCWGGSCLDLDGNLSYEPSPSNREEDWKRRHRFPLQVALELAERHVWQMRVNGVTAAEVIRKFYPQHLDRIPTERVTCE